MRGKFGKGKQRHAFLLAGIGVGAQAIFAAHCVVVKQQLTRVYSRNWKRIAARLERRLCLFFCCCCFYSPAALQSTRHLPHNPDLLTARHPYFSTLSGEQAGGRAGVLGREPPALFSSSSNSFNKLLLLLNEWRASVVVSWWIHSLLCCLVAA